MTSNFRVGRRDKNDPPPKKKKKKKKRKKNRILPCKIVGHGKKGVKNRQKSSKIVGRHLWAFPYITLTMTYCTSALSFELNNEKKIDANKKDAHLNQIRTKYQSILKSYSDK